MTLPVLQLMADGRERSLGELEEFVSQHFQLSQTDRQARLPSGGQTVVRNRVGWAKWHLEDCGWLETQTRGRYRISAEGQAFLATQPQALARATLREHSRRRDPAQSAVVADEELRAATQHTTPDERLASAHAELDGMLKRELSRRLANVAPSFFEDLVVQLLLRMGYGGSRQEAGQAVGRSGDGGIDGVINEDRLGLDSIYVQAKRWQGAVGEPDIRNFLGALVGRGAGKGVFITTSSFSEPARQFAAKSLQQRIVLIDGERLAELMIEHGLGVSTVATYEIKRIDSDFFSDD